MTIGSTYTQHPTRLPVITMTCYCMYYIVQKTFSSGITRARNQQITLNTSTTMVEKKQEGAIGRTSYYTLLLQHHWVSYAVRGRTYIFRPPPPPAIVAAMSNFVASLSHTARTFSQSARVTGGLTLLLTPTTDGREREAFTRPTPLPKNKTREL